MSTNPCVQLFWQLTWYPSAFPSSVDPLQSSRQSQRYMGPLLLHIYIGLHVDVRCIRYSCRTTGMSLSLSLSFFDCLPSQVKSPPVSIASRTQGIVVAWEGINTRSRALAYLCTVEKDIRYSLFQRVKNNLTLIDTYQGTSFISLN